MTNYVSVPLDSYRLAHYVEEVVCFICDNNNSFDEEMCTHCGAPMALAHQARSHKVEPSMLAVIGSPGAGKTVYLGMLMDMLARQTHGIGAMARGAFSITLQQETMGALSGCEFPEPTPSDPEAWNWVHSQIRLPKIRRPFEMVIPDASGGAIASEIDHPQSQPAVAAMLVRALGAILLIDVERIEQGDSDEEYFGLKALSYLGELGDQARYPWSRRPLAIVFTKADTCEPCQNDPVGYASRHLSSLWQVCQQQFPKHAIFATSVVGGSHWVSETKVPLRVEPRGLVEPFDWLMSRVKRQAGSMKQLKLL